MFKSLDVLGDKLGFFHEEQERVKTTFGGIFSVVMSILLFLLIASFGQDFFARKNPTLVKSAKYLVDSPLIPLNNSNFTFAFRLEDINTLAIKDANDKFIIEAHYYQYKVVDGVFERTRYEIIQSATCKRTDFDDDLSWADTFDLSSINCAVLDGKDYYIGGDWDLNSLAYIDIQAKICISGETYNDVVCSSKEEKIELINKGLFLSVFVPSTMVDSTNYDKGISRGILNKYFTLDASLYKQMDVKFTFSQMETDYGWLLESISTSSILGYYTQTYDINYVDGLLEGFYLGGVGGMSIYLDRTKDLYHREYPKAQDLAAQVGGILKIFISFGYYLVSRFNLHYVQMSFADFIIRNIDKKKLNHTIRENIKNNFSSLNNDANESVNISNMFKLQTTKKLVNFNDNNNNINNNSGIMEKDNDKNNIAKNISDINNIIKQNDNKQIQNALKDYEQLNQNSNLNISKFALKNNNPVSGILNSDVHVVQGKMSNEISNKQSNNSVNNVLKFNNNVIGSNSNNLNNLNVNSNSNNKNSMLNSNCHLINMNTNNLSNNKLNNNNSNERASLPINKPDINCLYFLELEDDVSVE